MANFYRFSVQMLLWAKEGKENEETSQESTEKSIYFYTAGIENFEIVKTTLAAEAHLAVNRFLHEEMVLREERKSKYIHIPQWTQEETRLWLHGIVVGSVVSKFMIKAQPFLMQLLCGIRCETGIAKSITTAKTSKKNSEMRVKIQLEDLRNLTESLPEKMIELQKGRKKMWQVQSQIYSDFAKARDILRSSDKTSTTCFHYHETSYIIKAQNVFIGFGEILLKYWKIIPETSYGLFLECLDLLLNRGELDLSFIGFVSDIILLSSEVSKFLSLEENPFSVSETLNFKKYSK